MTNVFHVMVNYTYTKDNVPLAQMAFGQKHHPTSVNLVTPVVKLVPIMEIRLVLMPNYPGF